MKELEKLIDRNVEKLKNILRLLAEAMGGTEEFVQS